jgi:predicted MPP superfamily phosphohydrolase
LQKPIESPLKVVFLSDLHLSSQLDSDYLIKIVNHINREEPDLVIFGGDIVDREIKPLLQFNAADILKRIESKLGVYAVSGNHEFYGGDRDEIISYLSSAGVIFLQDSVIKIQDRFYIVGRDDKTNTKRESLDRIIEGIDHSLPLILIDHQPYNMDEALKSGVDVKLSGHTHNGQFWPGNWVVKWIFENPYGHYVKDGMHTYVSSGAGIWGPLFRLGTKSEIVSIIID